MKKLIVLLLSTLVLGLSGCNNSNQQQQQERDPNEIITIHIPRELFFQTGSEEFFLAFFAEVGGSVSELADDASTFWQNYLVNAGTIDIEVQFIYSDLTEIRPLFEEELELYLETIVDFFESVSRFERQVSATATRFVLTADVDAFMNDWSTMELLDFIFPEMGQLEYLYRIFYLYDMTMLERIVFYIQDAETFESFKIYDFFQDAPYGLSIRHGVE